MNHYHALLCPGKCYHLFNHAVGDDRLFREEKNYIFFLKKWLLYTTPVCDTYCYNLLPNHFHFAVKIKSAEECMNHFKKKKELEFDRGRHNLSDFLMECFSNLCNSYAKSYNKVYSRKGALFIDYMKRKEITNKRQFCNLVNYIHFNAAHHGFCANPLDWKWTSMHAFLADKRTGLKRDELLKLYGGRGEFKIQHAAMVGFLSEYEFI